jgi:hypothetical protein
MRGQRRDLGRSKIQGLNDVRELANEDERGKNRRTGLYMPFLFVFNMSQFS